MNICFILALEKKCMDIVYKKPLVSWTIEAAKKSKVCDRIVLLSNDKNVLSLINTYNIETLHLKNCFISNNIYLEYLKNLPEKCNINKILLLSSLFPLRNNLDISTACVILDRDPNLDSVISTSKVGSSYDLLDLGHHVKGEPARVKHYSSNIHQANEAVCVSRYKSLLKYRDFREGNFATYSMNKISSIKIESSQDITIAEALFEWQNT